MTHVILVDANNALYRYGFAHKFLTAPDGTKTGAAYGILNCLLRLKKKYPSSRFVMVWDGPEKTWRHKLFDGYKKRPEKNEEQLNIIHQTPLVQELTKMMHIIQASVSNMEADDVIGLLAIKCLKQGLTPVVYSSDKDYLQLMERGVVVIRDVDKVNKLMPENEKTVLRYFDCALSDVLKVRALCGDTSDKIPNAYKGMGTKTAAKLVRAGIDTSGDFPPLGASAKLTEVWHVVSRNYRLIKIVTSTKDPNCTQVTKDIVELTLSHLHYPWVHNVLNFRKFISLLGELGMVDALQSRHELWKLQKS